MRVDRTPAYIPADRFDVEPAPEDREKTALVLRLRGAAPLRRPVEQANELDTPLFAAAASPALF